MQTVPITEDDLRLITNALNEILHGPGAIDEWEFETRIGATRTEAEALLRRIAELSERGRKERDV